MALEWRRKKADIIWAGRTGQMILGEFHATLPGYGIQLSAARTWIQRMNADDGGIAMVGTGAGYVTASRRILLTYAHTGNNSFSGGCDRASVNADLSGLSAHVAGHWGFLQLLSGGKVNVGGAVRGQVDLPSGAYSVGVVSAFLAASNDLRGTHNGTTAVVTAVHVSNSADPAGLWDAFATFGVSGDDHTGCIDAGDTKSTPGAVSKYVKINIAGTVHYIPAYTSKTS